MNHHLSFYQHYYQEGKEPIENKLSRALAIVLQNDGIFFTEFIRCLLHKAHPDAAEWKYN